MVGCGPEVMSAPAQSVVGAERRTGCPAADDGAYDTEPPWRRSARVALAFLPSPFLWRKDCQCCGWACMPGMHVRLLTRSRGARDSFVQCTHVDCTVPEPSTVDSGSPGEGRGHHDAPLDRQLRRGVAARLGRRERGGPRFIPRKRHAAAGGQIVAADVAAAMCSTRPIYIGLLSHAHALLAPQQTVNQSAGGHLCWWNLAA